MRLMRNPCSRPDPTGWWLEHTLLHEIAVLLRAHFAILADGTHLFCTHACRHSIKTVEACSWCSIRPCGVCVPAVSVFPDTCETGKPHWPDIFRKYDNTRVAQATPIVPVRHSERLHVCRKNRGQLLPRPADCVPSIAPQRVSTLRLRAEIPLEFPEVVRECHWAPLHFDLRIALSMCFLKIIKEKVKSCRSALCARSMHMLCTASLLRCHEGWRCAR